MSQAYIVTERPLDADILKRVLPEQLIQAVKFIDGQSKYGAESMASTLLASKRLPVVLVVNANMNDESLVREQLRDLDYLLRQAAAKTPFKIAIAIPEIAVIFFQDRSVLEGLIDRKLTDLEWQFAQHHPQELLDTLSGSSTTFIESALHNLSEPMIQIFYQHPLIQEIVEFLSGSLTPKQVSKV